MSSLFFLSMVNTSLEQFPPSRLCTHVPFLSWLSLRANLIKSLPENTFQSLRKMGDLDLSSNLIKELPVSIFKDLHSLQILNLSQNPLDHNHPGQFNHLIQLRSLGLEEVEIPNIQTSMFHHMDNLSYIYFKKFQYCSYAPHVRKCKPNSFEDLLANVVLRVSVWVMAFINCFGNLFVNGMRTVLRAENILHALCIKVLCCADCLMGVYLFFVGVFDVKFCGEYNKNLFSSTLSLLSVAHLRNLLVTEQRWTFFHRFDPFSLCLVLLFSQSFMFILVGLNLASVPQSCVDGCTEMWQIMANPFFFIVFSDTLCWIPIFLVKILSMLEVEILETITSWVVILILPINSALNPILYTLTTKTVHTQTRPQEPHQLCYLHGSLKAFFLPSQLQPTDIYFRQIMQV
uniref:Relaxin family peptide receptor 2b n=1 Tax=Cyprinus carpio TaxID=7962 RepID=A0A8C1VFY5_CYPCA